MPLHDWPKEAPDVPMCPALESWRRSVLRGITTFCLSCYCLSRCGCNQAPSWPFDGGVCAGCGVRIREVFPRAFPATVSREG